MVLILNNKKNIQGRLWLLNAAIYNNNIILIEIILSKLPDDIISGRDFYVK